ncbi:MAG: penicillin acylase family protein [Gammaproteobacteria bacterium]|nr:penicillin acylase family protein [Gammaproteobacteria bacterium]MBU0849281.1 penicillin acylase family protein [Gammaproteobacteria bacterium]MBU1267745.1 penicillin acylase family protein [Gammaproteobacteria bacterium]MBU1528213.1 penicillin acylase family protein [Gammaproteobacteria bacterium]MBU1781618.1 penicillin acylase family protein [Gammaproteobacteria bacterium]
MNTVLKNKAALRRGRLGLAGGVAALLLAGCLSNGDDATQSGADSRTNPSENAGLKYDVSITRTTFGVPHIRAKDYGSLGYGQGYAFAQDNLCVFLEDLLTIRGERSRFFGPDGTYTIEPNGSTANNVASDFFWKSIFAHEEAGADGVVRNAWQRTRDKTIPDFQNVVAGYADGVNRYIAELKAGEHEYAQADGSTKPAHAACANAQWLAPISTEDMYRRFVRLSILASSSVFVTEIGNAQPPGGLPSPTAQATDSLGGLSTAQQVALLKGAPNPLTAMQNKDHFGSNMYAFGKDATANGESLVYGNPHFPWRGTERLYLSHNILEMNGEKTMDIMGVGLYGVPAVLIGFNEHVAWSHTVSTAYRFTFYQLQINPSNPTQYMYDGEMVDMIQLPIEIEVKQADGSITKQQRTMYRSKFGPMLVLEASGVPVLGWNQLMAFTLRDANLENDRLINQFAKWNMAKSLEEFVGLHGSELGVPWVNTVASGPGKPAYYGDVTVVPHVTDEKVADCAAEPFNSVVGQLSAGLPVLDGSRAECEWGSDPDAPAPGIFGPGNLPTLQRNDYVTNCNDSYWLSNPKQPLTGFDRIIGDENAERTLRTRLCTLQAERRLAGTDGRAGDKFTQENLKEIALSSEVYSATLARQAVVDNICQSPVLLSTGLMPVQTAGACAALAAWDGKANLDSKGAHLWREFWSRAIANPGGLPVGAPQLHLPLDNPTPVSLPTNFWTNGFSATNPVNTPNSLNVANPFTQAALADAILAVQAAGFAFDKPLGEIQRSGVHTSNIPVFGGTSPEGAFTIVSTQPSRLNAEGYKVTYGNSYIQAVTWDDSGMPQADAMLTYSMSTDPANPNFEDYTKAYSQKNWQRLPFTRSQIEAAKIGPALNLRLPRAANSAP